VYLAVYAPALQLLLVGNGQLKPELKLDAGALRGDNFLFIPHIEDVIPQITSSKMFALTNLAEGHYKKLLKAMASRFSYVTSDIPGNGEPVEHSKARLRVHPNASKSLLGSF
jgi:hypothetical protein